jgi:hypothetical protein
MPQAPTGEEIRTWPVLGEVESMDVRYDSALDEIETDYQPTFLVRRIGDGAAVLGLAFGYGMRFAQWVRFHVRKTGYPPPS